jgi:hypothetical protein
MFEAAMSMLRATADVGKPTLRTSLGIVRPTLVSARPGQLLRVSVTRAGVCPGKVFDCDVLIDAASKNLVALIPCELGMFDLGDWPMEFGCVVIPGQGQTVAVCVI